MGNRSPWISQVLRFLFSTIIGLTADLVVYAGLLLLGVLPGVSNSISASIAVIMMYFLSSRFAFRASVGGSGVVLFFVWYALSIAGFSWLVQVGVDVLALDPIVSKIGTLPFSFGANFLATRTIFFHLNGNRVVMHR